MLKGFSMLDALMSTRYAVYPFIFSDCLTFLPPSDNASLVHSKTLTSPSMSTRPLPHEWISCLRRLWVRVRPPRSSTFFPANLPFFPVGCLTTETAVDTFC